MDRMGATNGLRSGFAEPDVANLSLLAEPRHCTDGIFDGNFGIDAMKIIEIEVVGLQPSQRRFAGDRNIFGSPVDVFSLCPRPWLTAQVAELAGENDVAALSLYRF